MSFDAVQLWLTQHPQWILGFIFSMSFFESLALIGLISPGIALLFIGGTAAGSAELAYSSVLLVAYAGAVSGDLLSYWLGSRFHSHMVAIPPFKQHPEWIEKAEAFFRRYGLYGLFIGRFMGPLRPVLPMIAGALELPFIKFLVLDLCSGPLWAAVYLTPGFLVGSAAEGSLQQTQPAFMFIGVWVVIGIAAAESLWRFSRKHRTPAAQANAALILTAISAAVLVVLYYTVLTHVVDPLNRWLAVSAFHVRNSTLDQFFVALTGLGEFRPMLIWALCIGGCLLLQRAWWPALAWVTGTLGGNVLMHGMKFSLGIERPHLAQRVPDGFSFPSGHASMGLIFTGLLIVMAWPRLNDKHRRIALHLAALYVVLVTASRLYLGVHWTSDLLAGWALGAAVIACTWLVLQVAPATMQSSLDRPRPLWLLVTTIAAWLGLTFLHVGPDFDSALAHYAPLYTDAINSQDKDALIK